MTVAPILSLSVRRVVWCHWYRIPTPRTYRRDFDENTGKSQQKRSRLIWHGGSSSVHPPNLATSLKVQPPTSPGAYRGSDNAISITFDSASIGTGPVPGRRLLHSDLVCGTYRDQMSNGGQVHCITLAFSVDFPSGGGSLMIFPAEGLVKSR